MHFQDLVDDLAELDPQPSAAAYATRHQNEKKAMERRTPTIDLAFARSRASKAEVNRLRGEFPGVFERLDVGNEIWQQHCRNLLAGNQARRMADFRARDLEAVLRLKIKTEVSGSIL
jgi:hypothetical protein